MKNNEVKISVIIPVYNAEQYLEKCLNSIINQKYPNWEAFVIDDASDDNSFQLMVKYAGKDNRIKIFQNGRNKGPGVTRNLGLSYVAKLHNTNSINKEYIVFLDSDDWVEKDYFSEIIEKAYNYEPDVIFIDVIQENANGKFIKCEQMSAYKYKSKETIIRYQMTGKLPWGGVRKAVKIDLILNNDIKYSDDAIGEEALYSFKLLHYAKKIEFIDKGLYHYVIHSSSQSGSHNDDPYGPICKKIESYLRKINEYDKYKNTLVSFAFTALIVSIYRKTQYYDLSRAIKQSRVALKEYKENYGFALERDSLELRIRCVLPLAKLNLVFPIIVIAKLKHKITSLQTGFVF